MILSGLVMMQVTFVITGIVIEDCLHEILGNTPVIFVDLYIMQFNLMKLMKIVSLYGFLVVDEKTESWMDYKINYYW